MNYPPFPTFNCGWDTLGDTLSVHDLLRKICRGHILKAPIGGLQEQRALASGKSTTIDIVGYEHVGAAVAIEIRHAIIGRLLKRRRVRPQNLKCDIAEIALAIVSES